MGVETSFVEASLRADIELAKGIGQVASSMNTAISILARAILELENPESNHYLQPGTREALRTLSETDAKGAGAPSER